MELKELFNRINHMKQSTVRIAANKIVYLDPFKIDGEPGDADIILISHTHFDHLSLPDIKKVAKPTTRIVVPADGEDALIKEGYTNILTVKPSENYNIDGLAFRTVPAYNLNKDFHKKSSNWVGYILNIDNTFFYFAGDTDFIPEMREIHADVVFLPVGGTYTMDAKEAAEAANTMKPLAAVPIHFADVVGTYKDAETFVKLLNPSTKGMILKARQ
jgi:L-ascorbate metabolism protein UlaG (beta-lactamase superfamily)